MKKVMFLTLLSFMMLFFLVACSSANDSTTTAATAATTTATTAPTTTAPVTTLSTTAAATTTAAITTEPATTAPVTTAPVTTAPPVTTAAVPTVNGAPLDSYTIVAEEGDLSVARLLAAMLEADYSITLPVATESTGRTIRLSVSNELRMNRASIATEGDGILLCGRGVNGAYLGAMAFYEKLSQETDGDLTVSSTVSVTVTKYLPSVTRGLLTAYGEPNESANGQLRIAFLGGSLTQDKIAWTAPVTEYFRSLYPDKTITTLNAGIGATDSEFGVARFEKDVLSKMTPDILFIDYAVNDGGFTEMTPEAIIQNGAYIEAIIKRCQELPSPPVIILLYMPLGQRIGTATAKWNQGVALKEEIAEHYGIGSVNIWEYFERLYLNTLQSEPTLSYRDFVLRYYAPTDLTHPMDAGFAVFGAAIIEALSADPEKYLCNKIYAETYLKEYQDIIDLRYELIPLTDTETLVLEGEWKHYTSTSTEYATDDPRYLPGIRVNASQLSDGAMQCDNGEFFSIWLETDAKVIKLYGINSPKGVTLDVLCEGVKIGTITTGKSNNYLYIEGVTIPDDGKAMHEIEIRPSEDNGENFVFRAGYVVLGFEKE